MGMRMQLFVIARASSFSSSPRVSRPNTRKSSGAVFRGAVVARGLGGGEVHARVRGIFRRTPPMLRMHLILHQLPVVQPRALQIFVRKLEAQRLDEMQPRARGRAGARRCCPCSAEFQGCTSTMFIAFLLWNPLGTVRCGKPAARQIRQPFTRSPRAAPSPVSAPRRRRHSLGRSAVRRASARPDSRRAAHFGSRSPDLPAQRLLQYLRRAVVGAVRRDQPRGAL